MEIMWRLLSSKQSNDIRQVSDSPYTRFYTSLHVLLQAIYNTGLKKSISPNTNRPRRSPKNSRNNTPWPISIQQDDIWPM